MLTVKNCKLQNQLNKDKLISMFQVFQRSFSKEMQINIKGQTINYLKVGNGPKNVLCFPGALGTIWSDFKPQIEQLDKNKFTVIAWDPPGYGYSRPPNRVFNKDFYENDAAIAHDFMKNIGIPKYSSLGWSDGGISSLILAATHPDSIDKLIVWGTNAYITQKDIESYEKIRDIDQWSEKMKAPLIKLYTEDGLRKMWKGWCDAMIEIHENGGNICKDVLQDIKCPTLILHGEKDPLVPPEHPIYLLNNIKNSKLHKYPEGKHNIHLRYADDFNKIASEFIL